MSLGAGLTHADVVFLAMPIDVILRSLSSVLAALPSESICLDVASTKVAILAEVRRLKPKAGYVSTHPIAGSEGSGIESAVGGLFDRKIMAMTPALHTSSRQIRLVKQLITKLGAKPLTISAKRHDHLLAHTSHLPYAIATALMHVTAETGQSDTLLWQMVGGSLQSATRVAKSSPELTYNLLTSNRVEVIKAVDFMTGELEQLKKLLKHGNQAELRKYIDTAHKVARKRIK
jgi:prephenate dehydrogenase